MNSNERMQTVIHLAEMRGAKVIRKSNGNVSIIEQPGRGRRPAAQTAKSNGKQKLEEILAKDLSNPLRAEHYSKIVSRKAMGSFAQRARVSRSNANLRSRQRLPRR